MCDNALPVVAKKHLAAKGGRWLASVGRPIDYRTRAAVEAGVKLFAGGEASE